MRCEMIEPHLAAYIDGELDEALRLTIEQHLKRCRACRESVRDMRLAGAVLSQWKTAEPSVSLAGALRKRIEEEKAASERTAEGAKGERRVSPSAAGAVWRRLAIAALVLVALGALFALWDVVVGPQRRTASQTMSALGRITVNVRSVEDLHRAKIALDGVVADQWASPRPDIDSVVQLETVTAMMRTASDARQCGDVGAILNILADEPLAMRLREQTKGLALSARDCVAAFFAMEKAAADDGSAELEALLEEALKLEEKGDLEAALEKYRLAAGDRLLALRSLIHQASIQIKLGEADEALATLDEAYRLTKARTFNREVVIELRARARRAIELRRKIRELKAELLKTEEDFDLLSEIGGLQVRAGSMKEAVETFEQILRGYDEPRYRKERLRVRLLRAWCLREMNRLDPAFDEFNRLIEDAETVYPEVATLAQHQRAKIFHLRGRYAHAVDDYTDLANTGEVSPGCYAALEFQVAYIFLIDLGNTAEAVKILKQLDTDEYRSQPFGRLATALLAKYGT